MDIDKLREEIAYDEGSVNKIYLDHLGLPTFGIGHLVIDTDPEHGQPVGPPVSEDRCNSAFDEDVKTVLNDCSILYDNFDDLPEEAQRIIANMMFNMGRPRLSKFKGMKRGVDARDWNAAADEMVDSNWYRQVTKRADRLVARMRAIEIDD
jgi:lysozyme